MSHFHAVKSSKVTNTIIQHSHKFEGTVKHLKTHLVTFWVTDFYFKDMQRTIAIFLQQHDYCNGTLYM